MKTIWRRHIMKMFIYIVITFVLLEVLIEAYLISITSTAASGEVSEHFRFYQLNSSEQHQVKDDMYSSTGVFINVENMEQRYGKEKPFKVMNWTDRSLVHTSGKMRHMLFQPIISTDEYHVMQTILKAFVLACRVHRLMFMLYGGSLLGAYRHHGMIPWDDDIDIFMNSSEKSEIQRALESVDGFHLYSPSDTQWKFYQSDSNNSERQYNWPFVDIFFFRENSTHIWDDKPIYSRLYCYKKSNVFPLQHRLFEDFLLPVPCDIESVLTQTYNVELCVNMVQSHNNEAPSPRKQMSLPCSRIYRFFPFVKRTFYKSFIIEELTFGDKIVSRLRTPSYC